MGKIDTRKQLAEHIDRETETADSLVLAGRYFDAFCHLERAHVLGQSITYDHARIHWRMLKLGWKMQNLREVFGQVIRIIGAATKTPFGIYPAGNTGGANVWFFKPMPVPADLQQILKQANIK